MVKIEDTLLEKNVVMHGIYEDQWEKEPDRRELIIKAIAKTVYDKDPRERLRIAQSAKIISTERLGKWRKHSNWPISICFEKKSYIDCLMTNKKFLPKEVFVDRQYCEETENNRRLLRPILKYAQSIDEYSRKCKLEHDTLIIKGLHYTVQTLHKLPSNLSGFHVSSRSNDDTLCFFGELSPFSNFHNCPIEVEKETFHSSEQYIQLQKARYFKDDQLVEEIKNSESALQCKKLGREVLNYNVEKWSEVAEEQCYAGILAKFEQNPELKQMLLGTSEKKIGESSPDLLWGTGIHLRTKTCLDRDKWKGKNIMGKMLEKIREKIRTENRIAIETTLSSLRMDETTANPDAPTLVAEHNTKATGRNTNKTDTGRNINKPDTGCNTDPVTAT